MLASTMCDGVVIRAGVLTACLLVATSPAWAQVGSPDAGIGVVSNEANESEVDRSERVVRATVQVTTARGTSLGLAVAPDGRVVVPLATVRDAPSVRVRYADGREDGATIMVTDEHWGLALIEPRGAVWREGLPVAESARATLPVRWAVGQPASSRSGVLRRRRTYVAADGELLRDAWEIDPVPGDAAAGSGIANARGQLVGLVVTPSANVPSGGATAPFGVPASIVRELVDRAGPSTRPWLGLVARELRRSESLRGTVHGIRVTDVTVDSPAASAGFIAGADGDIIVEVEQRAIRATQDLGAVLQDHQAGDILTFRVRRHGTRQDLTVTLGQLPGTH